MWPYVRPDALAAPIDERCRKSLSRYFDIVENTKTAQFLISRRVPVTFKKDAPSEKLWETHLKTLQSFKDYKNRLDRGEDHIKEMDPSDTSLLDLKITIGERILQECGLCEHKCRINRLNGKVGYCKSGREIILSSYFEHMGEEPELVPSGTIFTLGCTMRCLHCQNWSISQWEEEGVEVKPTTLAKIADDLHKRGCRNVNLVGGDPTSWLERWLVSFRYVKENVAVVWNSNSYYSHETAHLLKGFIDVYLLDFKYGPGVCSERISSAPRYWEVCTRNHLEAREWGELIIRILVLPDHLDCCFKPIVEWISKNLGPDTRVNVMFQYRPEWRAKKIPELTRRLTSEERDKAVRMARDKGLENFIT